MRSLLNRETGIWVMLAIAVLLTAAAGRYNIYRMESSEQFLQTSRLTLAELIALRTDLAEAETGHRGYILTGDNEYLEPFRKSDARIWDRLSRLQDQFALHSNQLKRLEQVELLVREKFDEMRRTISLHDTFGRETATQGVAQGHGKQVMDKLTVVLDEMDASEETRTAERTEAANSQYRIAEFTNILAAVLSIGILAGLAIYSRREERKRSRLTDKLAIAKLDTDDALARLAAFVQNSPYGIACFDPEFRYITVNETFARANGHPVEAHLGRKLIEMLPHFPQDLLADYQNVINTGSAITQRRVGVRDIQWEVTAFPIPFGVGKRGLGVIGVDVTNKLRQEEEIRLSNERFRAVADGIPQLAWMTRPDGHIFWYNQRWFDYTGTTMQEMEGWGWEKVHDSAELPRVTENWKKALVSGEPFEEFFPLRRHDGEMRWHLTRAIPSKDADGKVLLWFGTNTDITDQREAERQIRESEARFRTLTETMPQIVWTAAPDGAVQYFNSRWYEFTGAKPEQSLEWAWGPIIHPDDLERTVERWTVATRTGQQLEIEYRFRRHDGEYEWFLGRALPVRDESGTLVRWLGTCTGIDEHVRVAQALRESEARFRTLFESMDQGFCVIEVFFDPDGQPVDYRFVEMNPAFEKHTGLKNMVGLSIREAVPGLEEFWFETYGRVAATGEPIRFSHQAKVLGERWFDVYAFRLGGEGSRRVAILFSDISARKQYENRLIESEARFRELADAMPQIVYALKADGQLDFVNRRWVEYTGQEDAGPMSIESIVPEEDRLVMAERWSEALESGSPFETEFRLKNHSNGEYRWFLSRTLPIRNAEGEITRWYGTSTDINHRKRQAAVLEQMVEDRTATLIKTNAALREQQIFLDAILNNVMEGIVACDSEGRLKLFNAATQRMHGLPAEPLTPNEWAKHYQLYEADGMTQMPMDRVPLLRAWRGEVVQDAEMHIRTSNGADRYVLCSGVQLQANDGTQFGAVVSMRDMTERREYERRLLVSADSLQISNDALKASNEELEKFAYIASHDLQEPLRKIQAFGTRLATKYREALGDQGKDYIDRMLGSAGRMSKLIEDLLAFSRVTTKSVPFEQVDLSAVLDDVQQDLELRIQQSGGRIVVGPLPAVLGDLSQLRRVFQNLIGNALKFARPGVAPVVTVTATRFKDIPAGTEPNCPSETGWRITVADNGIGFEQTYSERIFELFQRLHARIEYEGTGLGLAIVRKIILRHGATIAAFGTPNVGATFVIDWPDRTLTPI
jgi:PAS domain S-box-containing protein